MKTLLALLGVALAMTASSDTTRILHPIDPVESLSITCGCMFQGETGHESWIPWTYLMLDPNGKPPNARINLGSGTVRLRPARTISSPMYQCVAGKSWVSRWLSETVGIEAKLRVLHPEEEVCWFDGTIIASVGDRSESISVRGACYCSE